MKSIRRLFILLAGSLVIGLGLLLMPLPGPGGLPVTLAGLAILSAEVPWARRMLQRLKERLRLKEAAPRPSGQRLRPLRSGSVGTTSRWLRLGLVVGLLVLWIAGGIIAWRVRAS